MANGNVKRKKQWFLSSKSLQCRIEEKDFREESTVSDATGRYSRKCTKSYTWFGHSVVGRSSRESSFGVVAVTTVGREVNVTQLIYQGV